MIKSGLRGCMRALPVSQFIFRKGIILIALIAVLLSAVAAQNVQIGTKRLLGDPRSESVKSVAARGAEDPAAALSSGSARPLALIAADVYNRGREDAVSGFMTTKGGAIVIQSARMVRGLHDSMTPFEPKALVINVPVSPDFLAVMDVNQDGRRDLVVGARGDSRLFVMMQGAKGQFSKPISVGLPGSLTALQSDSLGAGRIKNFVVAGVGLLKGGAVVVLKGTVAGLALINQSATPVAPSSMAFGNVDADPGKDLAVVAGGRVFVFHGDALIGAKAVRPESVSVNGTAVSVSMGTFLPHRGSRGQMAVLNSSGVVSILSRGTLDFQPYTAQEIRDLRNGLRSRSLQRVEPGLARNAAHDGNWTVVESVSTAAGTGASLMTSRTSGHAGDDISVVNSGQAHMVVISHGRSKTTASPQAIVTDTSLFSTSTAVVPMRVSADGRSGIIMLSQNPGAQPMQTLPPTTTTINVDTDNDTHDANPGDNNCDDGTGACSLRAAIEEANARNLNDTIVLPDGNYVLALGELDITVGMTITGQSGNAANVIIDGSGNGRVIAINPALTDAFDTAISGVTITDGLTTVDPFSGGDGSGLTWDAGGTGTLTLSNVQIVANAALDAGGGGLLLTNVNGGNGVATIADSLITENLADDIGGGVFVGNGTQAIFNNVTMDDNHADNTGGGTGVAQGGAYYFFGPSSPAGVSEIHGGSITNSSSISDGGAIYAQTGLILDAGTASTLLISLNSAGGNGGAIYQSAIGEDTLLANVTITGNTAGGNGSGIYENTASVTPPPPPSNVSMHYSRIAQNTSGGPTGVGFFTADTGAVVDVSNNWWACNTAPNAAPCNAVDDSISPANVTPWIVLTHTGTPNPIALGPAPDVALTASFLKDSAGGAIAPASIPALIGVPISFTAINGNISGADTAIQPTGTAAATLTVTAGPTASADAVVDGFAATVTITVQTANLSIAKSHTGNFQQGQTGAQYTITVSNSAAAGTAPTFGAVDVTDTLPGGLTATAISGTGWTCTLGTVSCTRSDVLAPGASYPPITVTVDVASNAPPSVTNTASVSGGGDPATKQITDPTTVLLGADLTITKTHVGNFTQGQTGATYTITVTNAGGASTIGTVTVSDTLPAGLTGTAISGSGWNCTLGTPATCTRTDALASGASYPAITLTVDVLGNAPATVTNTATVSGGAEVNTGNDTASDVTTVLQPADLIVTKSHVGNFSQGQTGATYSITVSNTGGSPTTGTVTVTDTLPTGLTATAFAGTGWTCTLAPLSCTRSDALAPGNSYPPLTLTVNVAASTAAQVTNSVTVSGGGETNVANDTATDATTVNQLADLTVTKTHTGNFFQGQNGATYTLTVKNVGTGTSSGTVTLTDTLPAGLTATAISGTGWTCTLAPLSCTRSDALNGGASYPVVALTVNVSQTATNVTNTATVSGGSDINNANNSASDSTTITAAFTMTIPNSTVTVGAGQPASFTLNLTYPTGASGTINFACSNVPTGSACIFNPPQVTMSSGGTAQVSLLIATHSSSSTKLVGAASRRGAVLAFTLFPAFGMVLLVGGRRRWLIRLGLVFILAIVAFGFTGCGGSPAPSTFTTPGTYDIGVTATTNTNLSVSSTVHVTVVKN